MKEGIVLAGGTGSRLGNHRPYAKSLALVYDRMMIEHPIRTLKDMGVEHTVVVSSPEGVADLFKTYRHTIDDVDISYETQYQALGSAHALGQTALGGVFPVLCGDVYFDPAPEPADRPTLYWHEFPTGNQHSVYDPETHTITEKPIRDIGKRAVIAYYYDEQVYDVIKTLEKSERDELELVGLHQWYLANGADVKEYKGFFGDMGTPDGLLRVANHIASKK